MLKPIDKIFLVHSITLESFVNDNGKRTYKEPEEITGVRVDKDRNWNMSHDLEADVMRNTIMVDKVNSTYTSFDNFTIDSKITFKGVTYTITGVKECADIGSDEIHHLEVYCE